MDVEPNFQQEQWDLTKHNFFFDLEIHGDVDLFIVFVSFSNRGM